VGWSESSRNSPLGHTEASISEKIEFEESKEWANCRQTSELQKLNYNNILDILKNGICIIDRFAREAKTFLLAGCSSHHWIGSLEREKESST
jgi:hypothetical protein